MIEYLSLKMAEKDKRDVVIRPEMLKFGVAVAVSLGGIIYTFIRSKRIKSSNPKPSHTSPGNCSQADSRMESGEDNHALQNLYPPKVVPHNIITDLSSSSKSSESRDGFLLPESKECKISFTTDDISPKKSEQSLIPNIESPKEHNKEIITLRNKVKALEEREGTMEIQLLEYYGLKEQETAIIELQNRIRLNNMESKLYTLKIESLQSDKRRLEEQVTDYAKVASELEDAKAKIKFLRKKLRSDGEHNREQILALQERVKKWRDEEVKVVGNDDDVAMKDLEGELVEMKELNNGLKRENSELARRLEYVQTLATSALHNEEMQELKQESQLLRQQNEDLRQQIEQLQGDRCTEIEELVYLRWVNACLRYEMRNYQPAPGKTIARDLSKSLSPRSEEKAKQLILEYANKEVSGDKTVNIIDFDSDQWSTSQTSYFSEPDESTHDTYKTDPSSKSKVFAKLMKLVRGKDIIQTSYETKSTCMDRVASVDDIVSRYSFGGASLRSYSGGQKGHVTMDDSSLSIFRRIGSISEDDNDLSRGVEGHRESQTEVNELAKYAEALKESRVKSTGRRRAASCSDF